MQRFVAIDFETANEQRCSACSVGLVRFGENGEVEESFYTLIQPHPDVAYFNPVNTWVHGICAEDVVDAPQWSDIADQIREFIGDLPIVAHNMAFDGYVLSDLASLYGLEPMENRRFCTLRLARKILAQKLAQKRLTDVYRHYFPGEEFAHHDAGADAAACGRIFARMLQEFPYAQIEELCPIPGKKSRSNRIPDRQTVAELIARFGANGQALAGHRVAFTGTLTHAPRSALQELVQVCGGVAENALTKKTTLLVVGIPDPRHWAKGNSASRKLVRASQLRDAGSAIQVLTEEEFFGMLGQEN